jgi:hypothetical protein
MVLTTAGGFMAHASCVLEELTTADLCGRFAITAAGCDTCTQDGCCEQATACRDSQACAALYDCLGACATGDVACQQLCTAEHPADVAAAALANCHASCEQGCALCGGVYADTAPGCDDCVRQQCCEQQLACNDDEGCGGFSSCLASCTDIACFIGCSLASFVEPGSEGVQIANNLTSCAINSCFNACNFGRAFACSGAFNWPLTTEDRITMTLTVTDQALAVIEGATVRACDTFCDMPVVAATTDASGVGELSFDTNLETVGFTGYFEASSADLVPSLVFNSVPLPAPGGPYPISAFTPSQADVAAMALGTTRDPARGQLLFTAFDCQGVAADGIRLDLGDAVDENSTTFFSINGVPSTAATATSGPGLGGVLNVKPGQLTIKMIDDETGAVIARTPVVIRAGHGTRVQLVVNPEGDPI